MQLLEAERNRELKVHHCVRFSPGQSRWAHPPHPSPGCVSGPHRPWSTRAPLLPPSAHRSSHLSRATMMSWSGVRGADPGSLICKPLLTLRLMNLPLIGRAPQTLFLLVIKLTRSLQVSYWFVRPLYKIQSVFVFSTTGTPAAVPKLSNAQISEHYSTCIKLSTENVSRMSIHIFTIFNSHF